jgi:hypothetical protein
VKSLLRCLSVSAVALAFYGLSATAAEKKDDKKSPFANVFTFPKTITLAEDQQKKLDTLAKEYTPKLEEAKKKIDTIITPERAKAQKEAQDKAKADGKKGKEVTEAGIAALKLSDDESKALADARKADGTLRTEIQKKKMELLTDDQKKLLAPKKPGDK